MSTMISRLTLKHRIMLVAGLLFVLLLSWYIISLNSDTRISRELKAMPQGSIQITNDEGRNITLQVRIADTNEARTAHFKKSGVQTIQDNIILMTYTSDMSTRHNVQNVKAPLDMGFFRADGTLVNTAATQVGSSATYGPITGTENRYRYVIVAPEGFFQKNGITANGGALLQVSTLRRL